MASPSAAAAGNAQHHGEAQNATGREAEFPRKARADIR
jgi:hypothetical protein